MELTEPKLQDYDLSEEKINLIKEFQYKFKTNEFDGSVLLIPLYITINIVGVVINPSLIILTFYLGLGISYLLSKISEKVFYLILKQIEHYKKDKFYKLRSINEKILIESQVKYNNYIVALKEYNLKLKESNYNKYNIALSDLYNDSLNKNTVDKLYILIESYKILKDNYLKFYNNLTFDHNERSIQIKYQHLEKLINSRIDWLKEKISKLEQIPIKLEERVKNVNAIEKKEILFTNPFESDFINNEEVINITSESNKSTKIIDFDEISKERNTIGELGEIFVLNIEKENQIKNNFYIENTTLIHASKTEGDGLGYDILSKSLNGDKLYIEVKTTKGNIYTPFYLSQNEYLKCLKIDNFFIYRVYDFDINLKKGKIYIIDPKKTLNDYFQIEPINYIIKPNKKAIKNTLF